MSATGALQPRDYVDVGAQVSGQLDKILVEVGSEVKEGDLLAEIDADVMNARVDASRAQLRAQQAQLLQQQANLTKAERDLTRQQNLMKEDATTQETLQNAQTALATTQAQIAALKAQMDQLRASTRVDESNLKYTKIMAPMSGTVVSITAKQGQTLNTNQQAPTILRIADLSTMTVQTQVSEADVSKLRDGMQAYFTTLGSGGRRWYGQLKKIEPTPTVTNNVVLYNALFEVPNDNKQLLPQMTAQVFFVAAAAHDVLVVPMSAVTLNRGPAAGGAAAGQRQGNADGRAARNAAAGGAAAGGAGNARRQGGAGQAGAGEGAAPGGAGPGAGGFQGSGNMQNLTPEQLERFREMRRQRGQAGSEGGGALLGAARGPRQGHGQGTERGRRHRRAPDHHRCHQPRARRGAVGTQGRRARGGGHEGVRALAGAGCPGHRSSRPAQQSGRIPGWLPGRRLRALTWTCSPQARRPTRRANVAITRT